MKDKEIRTKILKTLREVVNGFRRKQWGRIFILNPSIWILFSIALFSILLLLNHKYWNNQLISNILIGIFAGIIAGILVFIFIEKRETITWETSNKFFFMAVMNILMSAIVQLLEKANHLPDITPEFEIREDGKKHFSIKQWDRKMEKLHIQIEKITNKEINTNGSFYGLSDVELKELSSNFKDAYLNLNNELKHLNRKINREDEGLLTSILFHLDRLQKFFEWATFDLSIKGLGKEKIREISREVIIKEVNSLFLDFNSFYNNNKRILEKMGY